MTNKHEGAPASGMLSGAKYGRKYSNRNVSKDNGGYRSALEGMAKRNTILCDVSNLTTVILVEENELWEGPQPF